MLNTNTPGNASNVVVGVYRDPLSTSLSSAAFPANRVRAGIDLRDLQLRASYASGISSTWHQGGLIAAGERSGSAVLQAGR